MPSHDEHCTCEHCLQATRPVNGNLYQIEHCNGRIEVLPPGQLASEDHWELISEGKATLVRYNALNQREIIA